MQDLSAVQPEVEQKPAVKIGTPSIEMYTSTSTYQNPVQQTPFEIQNMQARMATGSAKLPKISDLQVRPFAGKIGDSVEEFLREFKLAIQMDEALKGSAWKPNWATALLPAFLVGEARRWYLQQNWSEMQASWEVAEDRLRERFATGKTAGQVVIEVSQRTKKDSESFAEFAENLKSLVRDVTDLDDKIKTQITRDTFCNGVGAQVGTLLRMQAGEPSLDQLVAMAKRATGGDGRVLSSIKRLVPGFVAEARTDFSRKQERREREPEKKKEVRELRTDCYKCYESGHLGEDCPNGWKCAYCKESGHVRMFCPKKGTQKRRSETNKDTRNPHQENVKSA